MDSARGKQSSKRTAWRSFFRFNVPNVSRQPLESQVQTAECYRETRERMQFMCVDTIVHVYRYTRYLVAQWHSHTTRLELFYILHVGGGGASGPRLRRPPPPQDSKSSVSVCFCSFALSWKLKPQSLLLSNRAGKLNWVVICIYI